MNKRDTSYVERDRCPLYTAMRVIEGRSEAHDLPPAWRHRRAALGYA